MGVFDKGDSYQIFVVFEGSMLFIKILPAVQSILFGLQRLST